MAQGQWFYTRGGQQAGPVSEDQLRQMVASGQVGAQELVWQEGMANWTPASAVPALSAGGGGGGGGGGFEPDVAAAPPVGGPYAQQPQPGYAQPTIHQPPYNTGYNAPYQPAGAQSYNGMAVGALVCSLVGILCAGWLLGTIAIILALVAKNGMKKSGNFQGAGMATAGLIIGIVDVILHVGLGIFWFTMMSQNMNQMNQGY